MLFAIDIDNTIAKDFKNTARRAYIARMLELPADEESARAYLVAPENQQRIQALYETCEQVPEVMGALQPIPNAQSALHELARAGTIVYVSCRIPTLHTTTVEWLTTQGFPSPENVFLCDSYHAKYLHAYDAAEGQPIVLIDDRAETIVRSFQYVARTYPTIAMGLIPRLTVVAFAPKEARWRMAPPPFPVLMLRSWERMYLTKLLAHPHLS